MAPILPEGSSPLTPIGSVAANWSSKSTDDISQNDRRSSRSSHLAESIRATHGIPAYEEYLAAEGVVAEAASSSPLQNPRGTREKLKKLFRELSRRLKRRKKGEEWTDRDGNVWWVTEHKTCTIR